MAQNTPRGTPARVLILFSLLTGAVMVSALQDARREDLFRVTYPTAVGDGDFYRQGEEPPSVEVRGAVVYLLEHGEGKLQRRDDRMFRVPLAAASPRLYTTSETLPENGTPPLYLKTGEGEFLRVEPRAGGDGKMHAAGSPR